MAFEALYIHIPFCKKRCRYCDFVSSVCKYGDLRVQAYVQKIEAFIKLLAKSDLLSCAQTAYVGGGTPTMLGFEVLPSLLSAVNSCTCLKEFSFEANPDSIDTKLLSAAKRAGATRISIGIQSFSDNELEALGRIHSAERAAHAVKLALKAGFDVSCDLMCGIPYQSIDSWRYSLSRALELGVGHVSVYPLMIEEGTEMERLCESGVLPWPDDDAQATFMETAEEMLGLAGYKRYEVASYAKDRAFCQHNVAYWTAKEYLGLGISAASMMNRDTYKAFQSFAPDALLELDSRAYRVRLSIISSIDEIIAAPSLNDLSFEVELLNAREAAAEDLMLAARMNAGISRDLYEHAAEAIPRPKLKATFDKLVQSQLLLPVMGGWQPTHAGWLLGNQLYGALWGLAEE